MEDPKLTQSDKFKEAAREIGADEDEARWDDRLRKVVKHKPMTGAELTAVHPDPEGKGS